MKNHSIRKVAATALAGTSIEFYDFFLYGTAAALVFPSVFFPPDIPHLGALLASFSTFAVGFFARPVGAVVFGHFGDRRGRKAALVASLSLMGASTALIGLLPAFSTAGVAAPISLVVLRILQGLALGGQWAGAALLVIESAPNNRRGYYGAFAQVGAPVGSVLANLAFLIMTLTTPVDAMLQWAWRIPFLVSVLLIALSLFIQARLHESAAFLELKNAQGEGGSPARFRRLEGTSKLSVADTRNDLEKEQRASPVLEALRTYPKEIMLAAGSLLGLQVSFYTLVSFAVAYGTNPDGAALSNAQMLWAVLIGTTAMIPGTVLSARISDRLGRRGVLLAGALSMGCWAFAIFPLIDTGILAYAVLALTVGQFLNGILFGPIAPFFAEMFPTRIRYSGTSLGYQIGTMVGGAVAPLAATALIARFGSSIPIAIYLCVACLISAISILWLQETYQNNLT